MKTAQRDFGAYRFGDFAAMHTIGPPEHNDGAHREGRLSDELVGEVTL